MGPVNSIKIQPFMQNDCWLVCSVRALPFDEVVGPPYLPDVSLPQAGHVGHVLHLQRPID